MLCRVFFLLFIGICSLANLCFSQNKEIPAVKKDVQNTPATSAVGQKTNPVVLVKTSSGLIKLELFPEKAPKSVENFLLYAKEGQYSNTIFHRVIDGFMIQGGGFTPDFKQKPTRAPIKIESSNGLKNTRGTVAMARTADPNSATSQFYINVADNGFLDYTAATPAGYGYTVFGTVTEGMDVVDKIAKTKTGYYGLHKDVPVEPVLIESVTVLSETK